ncbi:low-density lipoprotein receptor class A domain-containing protein 1 isoform X1 [Lethenteron reissneri]|uniref:low-density lipoprotein receptor class A domain-containing protein 1 isoform X1 n=1 Tax=Lethenteron reissneri TaxID=7753 RepID=UPI002AB6DD2C|nr:low-density lipoprotein receptor class A domain-containing protein 1 isoform X1 [Lethenteron reissneri]
MKSNRVHPSRSKRSRSPSQESFDSTLTFDRETGCCEGGCQRWCTQRCVCLLLICLLVVAVVAVAVALGVVFGVPKISGVNRECQTTLNQSGFLCDDRITCISPSKVCNQRSDCTGGADESTQYCCECTSDAAPQSVAATLVPKLTQPTPSRVPSYSCAGTGRRGRTRTSCATCTTTAGTAPTKQRRSAPCVAGGAAPPSSFRTATASQPRAAMTRCRTA